MTNNRGRHHVNYLWADAPKKADNVLNVYRGFLGSFPNTILDIPIDKLESFIDKALEIKSENDYKKVIRPYFVHREDPKMWDIMDWFHEKLYEQSPKEFGILDLSRY